ncbi:MAG: hypothetical protein JWO05_77 [Gemmatimonadetes bacterium]|nr:hypothetical protein [Gemmatimonadota bacterium]
MFTYASIDAPRRAMLLAALLIIPTTIHAQDHTTHAGHAAMAAAGDTAFKGMKERGAKVMGVDQESSLHHFDDLANGGRIALERDTTDSAGITAIRAHMREIAAQFASGDFSAPSAVHATNVPGTATMKANAARIRYEARDLPGGAEVRITTSDAASTRAVHRFLAYQRKEHRAPGVSMP